MRLLSQLVPSSLVRMYSNRILFSSGTYHKINGHAVPLAEAPIRKVFLDYVRHIGIGMLAMAIIGLLNMSKVVASVVKKCSALIFSVLKL